MNTRKRKRDESDFIISQIRTLIDRYEEIWREEQHASPSTGDSLEDGGGNMSQASVGEAVPEDHNTSSATRTSGSTTETTITLEEPNTATGGAEPFQVSGGTNPTSVHNLTHSASISITVIRNGKTICDGVVDRTTVAAAESDSNLPPCIAASPKTTSTEANVTTSLETAALSRSEGAESTSDGRPAASHRQGYWTENGAYVVGRNSDERRAGLTLEQQLMAIYVYDD
jgi:hypothetical protein